MTLRRVVGGVAFVAFLAVLAYLVAPSILRSTGALLVHDDGPAPADAAVVLAGDGSGQRMLKACELLRNGVVPLVLVNGPKDLPYYGLNEADAAIRFAGENGCDTSRLEPLYVRAMSTSEESQALLGELRRRGIRRLLMVTSGSHTARARRTLREAFGSEIEVRAVAARQKFFTPETWWHTREGQKIVFMELSKTVAHAVGL